MSLNKTVLTISLIFILISMNYSCKTKTSKNNNASLITRPAEQDTVPDSPPENKLPDDYEKLQGSIDAYKASKNYTHPQSKEEEAFNKMVDSTDALTREHIDQMVSEGKFTAMEGNIKILEKIETTDSSKNSTAHKSASENQRDPGQAEKEDDSSQTTGKKSSALHGAGTYLATTAVLGTLIAGGAGYMIFANRTGVRTNNKVDSDKLLTDFISTNKKVFALAGITGAGALLAFPMIVGSMIVAQEEPSATTINAAKVSLGLGAVASGTIGLASLAFAIHSFRSNPKVRLGKMGHNNIEKFYDVSFGKKAVAGAAGVIGIAFLGAAAYSAYTASKDLKSSSLQLTQNLPPPVQFLHDLEEFWNLQLGKEADLQQANQ